MSQDRYFDDLRNHLIENKQQLLDIFSARAAMMGWPEDVIKDIDLELEDANLSINYDEKLAQQISNLEYGNIDLPAKAAIRNFTGTIGHDISASLIDKGIDSLFDRGVFS